MNRLSFRQKIVLLAVLLVVGMQLLTLFPVLGLLAQDSDRRADRTLALAGAVLSEFFDNRSEQLTTTSSVAAADYGFRGAVATADRATIQSVLANHAARLGAEFGLFVDLEGRITASTLDEPEELEITLPSADGSPETHAVAYMGNRAFEIVNVAVRSPLPIGYVVFGFEVGRELVFHLNSLTGLDVTFLRFHEREPIAVATTMDDAALVTSLAEIRKYGGSLDSDHAINVDLEYLTLLRPLLVGSEELFVALQMPVEEAEASYRDIRQILIAIAALSLIAAIGGSVWVASMVTRPVQRLAAAVRRMREGVYTDAVESDSPDEFGELAAGFNEMQTAIAEREDQIFRAAHYDELTSLPNRLHITGVLDDLIRCGTAVDVVSISITRINRLVVSLGQQTSDQLVKRLAEVLRASIDREHTLAYMQGHEFVLVFVKNGQMDVGSLLDDISRILHQGVRVGATSFSLQLRAGVTSYPEHANDAAALLYRAGIARIEAEAAHEFMVTYTLGQEELAVKQTRLIGEFPAAVRNDELLVYFQPKVSCRSRQVRGAEALIRWRHPELGLLTPYEFVGAIEQAGGISTLTRWMLRAAIAECRRWQEAGVDLDLSVNISADDLLDEYLPYYLLEQTSEHGIRPMQITLEVTESAIMHNLAKSLAVVACIHEIGFKLSIDDFGTGHSSLAQLKRLPVSELKIDRSFIRGIEEPKDEPIVVAMIELAQSLGLDACVEGIEDLALLARLDAMGVRFGQGYAISRPLPADEFLGWYRGWTGETDEAAATQIIPRAVV